MDKQFVLSELEDMKRKVEGLIRVVRGPKEEEPILQYNRIFEFKAGDVNLQTYEQKAGTFPGRFVQGTNMKFECGEYIAAVRANNHVPRVRIDGSMEAVRPYGYRTHIQWSPWSSQLNAHSYLHYGKTYRIELEYEPLHHNYWGQPDWDGWLLIFQGWGPHYPIRNASPPLFLRVQKGEWRAGIRPGVAHTPEWKEERGTAPFENKRVTWKCIYKPHQTDGYVKWSLDGEEVFKKEGGATCLTHDFGLKDERGPGIYFGCYRGGPMEINKPAAGGLHHRFTLDEILD